jgi:hypothetical protein
VRRYPSSSTLCLTLALCALRVESTSAEVFLSPHVESVVGYASNRLTTDADGGSGFLAVSPILELTHFASETTELSGLLSYERREHLREGFSHTQTSHAVIGLWHAGLAWEGGFTLAAGDHHDGAVSTGDATWYALSPGIVIADLRGGRYSLSASVTAYSYESWEASDGGATKGTQWSLRPGVVWPLLPKTSFGGEAWLEWFSSAQEADNYGGGGIALGLTYAPPARVRAGVTVELGMRHYDARAVDNTLRTDGRTSSVQAWYALRLTPRTELVVQGKAGTYRSNDRASDCDQWQLHAGLKLADDFQIGSSRF